MHYKRTTWLDVKEDFGAKADGSDDTAAIQQALNYADASSPTYDKKIRVHLGNGIFHITGLIIPRGVTLYGDATLVLIGAGNVALKYISAVHCLVEGIKILLTANNQVGIGLGSVEGQTQTQLNTFRNIWVEGDNQKNSVGLKIDKTWTNSFYDCKFFRCNHGVQFIQQESNANFFYGCEIRHRAHTHGELAILHMDGKNNVFFGGVIENYKACVYVRAGDLTFKGVYTEGFAVDRPFLLQGGSLTLDSCLVKGRFEIRGGTSLRVVRCVLNRGGVDSNLNSPLIKFTDDLDTSVWFEGNNLPPSTVVSRYGEYYNGQKWLIRSPHHSNETLTDYNSNVHVKLSNKVYSVTGDGTDYSICWGTDNVMINSFSEFNGLTGIFTPIQSGFFRVECTVYVESVSDSHHSLLKLFAKESGGSWYMLAMKNATARSTAGVIMMYGSCVMKISQGKNLRMSLKVEGNKKDIDLNGGRGNNVWSYLSIERK